MSDGGIYIHCSDGYLITKDEATRKYSDNTKGKNVQVDAPQPPAGTIPTENACGGFAKGFAYSAGPQQVIILCSDSPAGALNSCQKGELDDFRGETGNLRDIKLVQEKGIDVLGMFLSTIILHELMHTAGFAQQLQLLPAMSVSDLLNHLHHINTSQSTPSYQIKSTTQP